MNAPIFWLSPVGGFDDFDAPIGDEMIDGKTKFGPWGIMAPASFAKYGVNKLGLGLGQRYKRQPDGRWLKIEG